MEERAFWIRFCQLVAAILALLILSVSGCVSYRNTKIVELVKTGIDPKAAACALSERDRAICATLAVKKD